MNSLYNRFTLFLAFKSERNPLKHPNATYIKMVPFLVMKIGELVQMYA